MLRADFATSETYRYEPLPPLSCPLTVLGGISDPTTTRDELRAWAVHRQQNLLQIVMLECFWRRAVQAAESRDELGIGQAVRWLERIRQMRRATSRDNQVMWSALAGRHQPLRHQKSQQALPWNGRRNKLVHAGGG